MNFNFIVFFFGELKEEKDNFFIIIVFLFIVEIYVLVDNFSNGVVVVMSGMVCNIIDVKFVIVLEY